MAKETTIVAFPERMTVFHVTALARMSGRLARRYLCGIGYFHPVEEDREGDKQRLQKLIQKAEP